MTEPINNRYDFVLLFDVQNGNPNGDPDAANMPRVDPETGLGLVTDVCIKRKIRNYVQTVKEGEEGFGIYIRRDASLNEKENYAREKVTGEKPLKDVKKNDSDADLKVREYMCANYYDIRTFGAVLTTLAKSSLNYGQVRGPVQLGFAQSFDPIDPQEITITRMAITRDENVKEGQATTMGRKHIVHYALYRMEGYVSANFARQTGFSEDDLNLLWQAIAGMFEDDRSAARGNMALRELVVFKHESKFGNAPAWSLFKRVQVTRKDETVPPRSYDDYNVVIDVDNLPSGVSCERKI